MTRHPVTLLHFDPVYAGVQDSTKGTIFDAYLMKGSSAMAELQNRWLGRLCYCQGRDTWDNIDTPGCREGLSLWYCYVDYESMMGKHHDLLKAWDDRTQWCHPKLWFLYVNNYMYIYIYIWVDDLTEISRFYGCQSWVPLQKWKFFIFRHLQEERTAAYEIGSPFKESSGRYFCIFFEKLLQVIFGWFKSMFWHWDF